MAPLFGELHLQNKKGFLVEVVVNYNLQQNLEKC